MIQQLTLVIKKLFVKETINSDTKTRNYVLVIV